MLRILGYGGGGHATRAACVQEPAWLAAAMHRAVRRWDASLLRFIFHAGTSTAPRVRGIKTKA